MYFCQKLIPVINIAIFASGAGSNAEVLAKYFENHAQIKVTCVIYNRKQAGVVGKMERYAIPCVYLPKSKWENPDEVIATLENFKINAIVLAGFLLKIPEKIIQTFPNRIINIHPSLLPKFGGKGMYGINVHKAVEASGEKESGITIHIVNEEFDKGRIIFQASCKIEERDTAEIIAKKVQELEHMHFAPEVEKEILKLC